MPAITFLNFTFWPWLFVLGIPIAIHLLTRQIRRERELPTLKFLRQAQAQQSRLYRVRKMLLLALRLLLLFFLVLTFLKPTVTAPLARMQGEKRAVVLVLDVSLSMGYERGGARSLARAQGQAMQLLDDLRPGDMANVILAGASPRPVQPKMSGDFGALRQAVKMAKVTPERGDMASAVSAAAEQLAGTEFGHQELLLASDFQRTNWADVPLDMLPADVKLVLLNSDTEVRENSAVTGVRLRPMTPRTGEEANVVAEVWNGSRTSRTLSVSLDIAGERTPKIVTPPQSLTIPPYATGTVSFPVTFPDAGRYRIQASVPADTLPADNTRYLAADLRHSQTALLLTDASLTGSSGSYFLSRALNPTPDVPGGIRVVTQHPSELTETQLKTCDIILMSEIETLPADRLPLLARYVNEGGALLVFLSGTRSIGQMQALAKQARPGEGLPFLPTTPIDISRQGKGYVTLTEARYESPLLKLFKDPAVADIGKIRFTRFFLCTEPDTKSEVLLKFEDGTPAAARRNFGAGTVLLCNFSPAPADSDLARQEVFPPLLHEFLKGLTAKEGERKEFLVGGIASATLDTSQMQGTISAVAPNGEPERITADRAGGGVLLEQVALPGFHTVLANGQPAAVLGVNVSAEESDLRSLDLRELQSRRSNRTATWLNVSGGSSDLNRLRQSRPLWPYCLLLAFLFLLLEHGVAALGRRK